MEAKQIKAVEMVRQIREANARRFVNKSHAERISFYREQARKMEKMLPALLKELGLTTQQR